MLQLNIHPGLHCDMKQKHRTHLCTATVYVQTVHLGLWGGSEVKQIDKVLWGEGYGAAVWVVRCAGMVGILPEKDVTVCAEVQGIAVLLSVRIASAQLKVHPLPLQMTFIRHHQTLADLSVCEVVLAEFLPQQPVLRQGPQVWTRLSQTDQVPAI